MSTTEDAQEAKLHTDHVVSVSYGEIGLLASVGALFVLVGLFVWRRRGLSRPNR